MVDETSKKLIKFHLKSHQEGQNPIERQCWKSLKEIIFNLAEFLVIFMEDSVFIDYFESTWIFL